MIVSASYRTDIPAFYGEWFLNRLRTGFCRVVNPYGGQSYRVGLRPGEVDGFVFWTRNAGPFWPALKAVRWLGLPFVVQHTVTGYPRALETSVVEAERGVELIRRLAGEFGPRVAVWRYDPIVATNLTPADWHAANVEALARKLEGATDEMVVSFAHIYRKTARNMDAAARIHRFAWSDPAVEEKRALLDRLAPIAHAHGMRLTVCSQPGLIVPGAEPARCVDAERLAAVAGRPIRARAKGNRPGCLCAESRDIGDYDTCPHGCAYCYAVGNRTLAKRRHREHDPEGEFLFPPTSKGTEESAPTDGRQGSLF